MKWLLTALVGGLAIIATSASSGRRIVIPALPRTAWADLYGLDWK